MACRKLVPAPRIRLVFQSIPRLPFCVRDVRLAGEYSLVKSLKDVPTYERCGLAPEVASYRPSCSKR